MIKDGVVYTPDLSAGALNGITRNTVLHICKDLGLEVVQKRITRDELYIADEVFFTGTAAEVTPIREVDRVQIGEGRRGPVTEKIQTAFFDIVNGAQLTGDKHQADGVLKTAFFYECVNHHRPRVISSLSGTAGQHREWRRCPAEGYPRPGPAGPRFARWPAPPG